MMHIRLIAPIHSDLRSEAYLRALEQRFAVALSMVCVERGPVSIETEVDRVLAGPETVRQARKAAEEGCDAIIIDCMMDPAVAACREAVAMPVLAPSETGMHLAAMSGHRFSVLAVLERQSATYRMLAREYGAGERLASVRGIGIPVLKLDDDPERLRQAMVAAARRAVVDDGADTLLLGCTALENGAAVLKQALAEDGMDIAVIEALPLTVGLASVFVRSFFTHSKRAYPTPPPKAAPGYPG